jgi:HlyD family secretion protein
MQVECDVDEADVGKIQEGQKVRFTVDSFPDSTFNGTVKQVRYSPTVTQNVVTYVTIVDVENPGMKLRPGMTATVNIITGEAKGVLRVPNSALRFTPTLSAEEIQQIMKEAGEKMRAQMKPEGGPGQTSQGDAGRPQQQGQGGGQRMMMFQQGGGMPQGAQGTGSGQRSGRRPSMVWYMDAAGKLNVAFLRPGVTDNSYTEILRSELKEGQEIIVGLASATQTAQSTNPQQGRPPMMFMGR